MMGRTIQKDKYSRLPRMIKGRVIGNLQLRECQEMVNAEVPKAKPSDDEMTTSLSHS